MRRPIIAGNWKLNKTIDQAVDFVVELQSLVDGTGDVEVVVAPAFTALSAVANALNNSSIEYVIATSIKRYPSKA